MTVGPGGVGGGLLPYKGLMGTCGQPGYVFRDFCLKQGIDFINYCHRLRLCSTNVLNWVSKIGILSQKQGRKIGDFCLKQGQGMRSRAAPPHPRIYRVPPPPGSWQLSCLKYNQKKPRFNSLRLTGTLYIRNIHTLQLLKWNGYETC